MYTVYHIPGIKVGCTDNPQKRIVQQQGYTNYEVLLKTESLEEASSAEITFQQQLGYSIDETSYKNIKMINTTNHTTTFKTEPSNINRTYLSKFDSIKVNDTDVAMTEHLAEWILGNLHRSKYNNEMFIYNQAFLNASIAAPPVLVVPPTIHELIREWATEKGIYQHGDLKTQTLKLYEEAGELSKAILNSDLHEVIDAIGDCVVVLTSIAELANQRFDLEGNAKITIESCTDVAYNVISKRSGKMENGTFVKNDK